MNLIAFSSRLAAVFFIAVAAGPVKAQTPAPARNPAATVIPAVIAGDTALVKRLLDSDPELARKAGETGDTPLHWAASAGSIAMAELLISKGADIEARTSDGLTPLHWAASKGRGDVAVFLLHKGADINAQTREMWTPLHVAAYHELRDTIEILLAHGANPEAKDIGGLTPREVFLEKCRLLAKVLAPAEASADIKALAAEGMSAAEKIEHLEGKLREVYNEKVALQNEVEQLREALKKIKPGPSPADLEVLRLREAMDAAEFRLKEFAERVKSLEKERDDLAGKLGVAETAAAVAAGREDEIAELRKKTAVLEEALKASCAESLELQDKLKAAAKTAAVAAGSSDALEAESAIKELVEKTALLETRLKESRQNYERLYIQLIIANQERDALDARLSAFESEN